MTQLAAFYRGDDHALELVVRIKDEDEPVDVTGWVFTSTLKLSSEMPDQPEFDDDGNRQVLQIQTTAEDVEDSKEGIVFLHYPASMTKDLIPTTYEIDIQVQYSGVTQTLIKGQIPVLPDVSHGDR